MPALLQVVVAIHDSWQRKFSNAKGSVPSAPQEAGSTVTSFLGSRLSLSMGVDSSELARP